MTDLPPQLIDVNLRGRYAAGTALLLVFIGIAGVVALGMLLSISDEVRFVRIILCQIAFLAALTVAAKRTSAARLRRRVEDIVQAHHGCTSAQMLEEAFNVPSIALPETRSALLPRALVAASRVNTTIRNCSPKCSTPVEPLTVPFEPLRLEEADTFFGELQDSLMDQPDADLLEPEALEQLRTENTRETQPRLAPKKGIGWVLAGLLVLPAAAGTMFLFGRGNITWPGIFVGLLALFGLLSWGYISGLLQGQQWFIVPGGLVLREARLIRPEWQVHLFDRRRSVLIVHRIDDGRVVFVADSETAKRVTVSPDVFDSVLRAWLSPIPPPSLEQLTDLT